MRAFDPQETLAVHCGDGFDADFSPLSKHSFEALGYRLLSLGEDMQRREFIRLLGGTAVALPVAAPAQQPAMPLIGVMIASSAATSVRNIAAFRNGLRELGYTDGRNVRIEYRSAEGMAERYPAIITDLVALNPAVILVGSAGGALAARAVTRTIPLIMFAAADNPVALGLAESFARPGGNITGFLSASDAGIIGKRLELLREAVPAFSRLGVFVFPADAAADGTLSALPVAAHGLGLDARVYEARSTAELEAAFAAALRDKVQALYVAQSPVFYARRAEIVAMAASMRLPAIYFFREFVQAGGLMSYSADLSDQYRRAATYSDKILKAPIPASCRCNRRTSMSWSSISLPRRRWASQSPKRFSCGLMRSSSKHRQWPLLARSVSADSSRLGPQLNEVRPVNARRQFFCASRFGVIQLPDSQAAM